MKVKTNIKKNSIFQKELNLEKIIKDPNVFPVFQRWAAENLCAENLLFYFEVERFSTLTEPEKIKEEAQRIYNKFIKEKSECQINLDFESKKEIADRIANPSGDMYNQAFYIVCDNIKYDLVGKFLDSDTYREWKGLPKTAKHSIPRKNKPADIPKVNPDSLSRLDVCLKDPEALEEFLKFTKKEYSDAVLLFYLEVEKFQENPSVEYALQIFQQYLGTESKDEVDTDPKVKKQIWQLIQDKSVQRNLFDKLQTQVFAVMAQDSFFRFQNYMISRLSLI